MSATPTATTLADRAAGPNAAALRRRRSHDFNVALGARIRALRVAAGVSQAELGAALGVTQQQMHNYEYGLARTTAECLDLMAEMLDVHPGAFFGEARPPSPEPGAAGRWRAAHRVTDPGTRRRLMELIEALATTETVRTT